MAVDHQNTSSLPAERSTVAEWAQRNGCSPTPMESLLPDSADDGTTVTRYDFTGCDPGGDISSIVVTNGGHTWPGGYSPLDLGLVSADINANEVMLEFFLDHPIIR